MTTKISPDRILQIDHPALILGHVANVSPEAIAAARKILPANVVTVNHLIELRAHCAAHPGWSPELALVFQNWPDEYSVADVHSLLTQFPLARFVCCYGPWCEADGRSRDIWPLACRVPSWGLTDRLRRELQWVQGVEAPDALPLTASRTEMFAARLPSGIPDRGQGRPVLAGEVISGDSAWQGMFERLWRLAGHELIEPMADQRCDSQLSGAVGLKPGASACLIIDLDTPAPSPKEVAQRTCSQIDSDDTIPQTPVKIGVTNWIDGGEGRRSDVAAILCRLAPDLIDQIEDIVARLSCSS